MNIKIIAACLTGVACLPADAHGEERPAGPAPAAQQAQPQEDRELVLTVVSDDQLGEQRGGQTLMIADQTLKSIIAGNTIGGDYFAGSISLSDSALSNFNGIGNIVINTGAHNSLQSGMNLIVNVGD